MRVAGQAGRGRRQGGFTLIELLVALAIAAGVLGLVLPSLARPSGRTELAASAREVAGALRMARGLAIARNRPAGFVVDTRAAAFGVAGQGPLRPLPRGIALAVFTTAQEAEDEGRGIILFHPDGSSTGGGVSLMRGGLRFDVLVDWFSGGIAVHER